MAELAEFRGDAPVNYKQLLAWVRRLQKVDNKKTCHVWSVLFESSMCHSSTRVVLHWL